MTNTIQIFLEIDLVKSVCKKTTFPLVSKYQWFSPIWIIIVQKCIISEKSPAKSSKKKLYFINIFSKSRFKNVWRQNNTFNFQNHTLCTVNRLGIKPVLFLSKYQVQSSPQWFWDMRKNISDPNSLFLTHSQPTTKFFVVFSDWEK